jgi:hypothetical protein
MCKRFILSLAVVAGLLLLISVEIASAQVSGRCKIVCMDGRTVEGDVKELEDAYEVTIRGAGRAQIIVTIKKRDVLKVIPLESGDPQAGADNGGGPGGPRLRSVTEGEIQEILGSENLDELSEYLEPPPDYMAPLPTNPDGLAEMKRITGGGKQFETPHFLLVYTSDVQLAKQLGGRLESVYRWSVMMMKRLGIPFRKPEYKLETYLFGTHEEFRSYARNVGFELPGGVLGFYYQVINRAAFFDMETYPPNAAHLERAEDPDVNFRERRRLRNLVMRRIEHANYDVVQHEAAHHIHWNIGFFPRGTSVDRWHDVPKWVSEGLAQLFEVPPGKLGGSLGATNHLRLAQFRSMFGYPTRSFPNLRMFILNTGDASYPPAWALTYYLWKERRAGYAKFMRKIAQFELGESHSLTEMQQIFEDCFGPIDEDFEKDLLDFLNSIQLRRSVLPP